MAELRNCAHCGGMVAWNCDTGHSADAPIDRCVVCGGQEFFIRKDFPQRLGLALVVVCALVASVFYYYENIPATFAALGTLVVVDTVIYFFVGKVTVCYKCRAEYRGLAYNPDHQGFDLATSEKYER